MSKFEHRRKDVTEGDDPDWAATHTAPPFGGDVAAGELRPLVPSASSLVLSAELVDGAGDPVDPVGVTIDVEVMSMVRVDGVDVFDAGNKQTVLLQRRLIELHVPKGVQHWVRITNIQGAPGPGTIRIYVAQDVKT